LNPLEIPTGITGKERDIAITETTENFISLLKHDWTIGEVQEQRARTCIAHLYEQSPNPTIGQLIELLENDSVSKLRKFKKEEDNLPGKLQKFCFGFYGEIFNQSHTTIPFDKITNAITLFELGKLPLEMRSFFVTVFLNQWWNWRRVKNPDELIPNIMVLDEFQHYDEMAIARKLLSEGRKYKQGIICSLQGPHQITDPALHGEVIRNTVTKVFFRTQYTKDIYDSLASIGLQDKAVAEYLPKLELGEAIVTLYEIPQPFKIITNAFPKPEITITDEQVRELSESLIDAQPTIIKIKPQQLETENNTNEEEKEFLRLLYEKPHSSANDIIREMRIMRSKGWDIKNKLVDRGLIIEETIRAGKGRPKKILKLTDEGYSVLGVEKEGLPAHHGKEEHLQIIKNAADILTRDGWNVTVEDGADIKAEKGNKRIAVEIETCKAFNQEQIIQNIAKNLKWADKIVIISPNLQTTAKIRKLTSGQGFEKVTFLTYEQITAHLLSKMDRNLAQNDIIQLLRDVILNLDNGSGANEEEIIAEMAKHGISEGRLQIYLNKLKENGTIIEQPKDTLKLVSE
jgi:DNA-binding MarR family transcriptional regulator